MVFNPRPSGASSPFVSGEQVDAWGAVVATQADVTARQRAIEIGTRVPIVFGKAVNGGGGVWVTPPAARFGAQVDVATGTNVSIGLVISDGQVGTISAADVYKGAAKLSELPNSGATFAYGYMPEAGFNYSLSTTTIKASQEFVNGTITSSYSFTRSNALSLQVISLKCKRDGSTDQLFFYWRVYVNGALHSQSGSLPSISLNLNLTWATPSTVTVEIIAASGYSVNAPATPYSPSAKIQGEIQHTYAETGAPVDGSSELPVFPGAGGSFAGLSCLAIRGRTDKIGAITVDAQSSSDLGGAITGQRDIYFPNIKGITITGLSCPQNGSVNSTCTFRYQFLFNGAIVQDSNTGLAGAYSPSFTSLTYGDLVLRIIPWYKKVDGAPFPNAGYAVKGKVTTIVPGGKEGGATPLGYEDQVRCFVRNGVSVENLLTGATGSSDNFADFALHLMRKSGRVPESMIDIDSFRVAARFTNANQLLFNGVLSASVNLREYLQRVAPYFLLRFCQVDGKFSLLPVLSANADGGISSAPVTPVFTFGMANIIPGTLNVTYIGSAQRQPIIVNVAWRNQSSGSFSTTNVVEVRESSTATTAPVEVHDISDFCTSYNHAATFGKYFLAARKYAAHAIELSVPQTAAIGLRVQQIIAVDVSAIPSIGAIVSRQQLYRVEMISESASGTVQIKAAHVPVAADGVDQVVSSILQGSYQVN